jgi:hypothetical protein
MTQIKKLGLLAIAAMALVAFAGVSSASAAEFTTSEEGAPLKTELVEAHVFSVTGASVECGKVLFEGKAEAGETQTVQPVYEECEFGGLAVAVNTNGCSYTFKADTGGDEHATVNLSGCTNGGITLTVNLGIFAKCTIFVKNQSIENAVHYTDTEGTVDVEATATSVHAEVTTSDGLCPVAKGTHTNATYKGASKVSIEGGTVGYEP